MINVNRTVIMTLDKRYEMSVTLKAELFDKGYEAKQFIMGDGHLNGVPYDYVDTPELPRRHHMSTSYATWFAHAGAYNMWKAQQEVFISCMEQDVKRLFLLEDDAKFRSTWAEMSAGIADWINSHDWDMVYLGSFLRPEDHYYEHKDILRLTGRPVAGFHSILLGQKAISILAGMSPLAPYDELAWRFLHADLKCYAVNPALICQRPCFSYIEQQYFGREDQQ